MALTKSQFFLFNVFNQNCNVTTETVKLALVNTLPVVATAQHYSDLAGEVANGNGYTTGGAVVSFTLTNTTGTCTYTSSGPPTFTATGGNLGPFRYLVYYMTTSGVLIGWDDYGSSITLLVANSDTFTPDNTSHILFTCV
jgi:hypothetical protein